MRFESNLSTDETFNFFRDLKNEEKRNLFANLQSFSHRNADIFFCMGEWLSTAEMRIYFENGILQLGDLKLILQCSGEKSYWCQK